MRMKKFRLLVLAVTVAAAGAGRVGAGDAPAEGASNANLALARQLNEAFVQVAEEVSPSVVVITVTEKAGTLPTDAGDDEDGQQNPSSQIPPELRRYLQSHKSIGQGSGIIIRPDGFILTNGHVVEGAEKIEVRLRDGRTYKATVRGVDLPSDVAVIKIDEKDLPVAKLADSSRTRVGEFAIAIGAPFALDYTVTFGHVSAKDRSKIMDEEEGSGMLDQNFIQTDANINPGNSGGPLVNVDGEVIGVNTLIRGLHTGIGFAIPSNLARDIADKLISDGKYPRSWLGVEIESLREDPDFRDLVPGVKEGVVVREVIADGPASKSDLKPADVVTAIDGKPVVTSDQLKEAIRSKKPGTDVTLSVFRQVDSEGKRLKIIVQPGEWTDSPADVVTAAADPPPAAAEGTYGMTVSSAKRLLRGAAGVLVRKVEPDSVADQCNIQEGDIITAVGGQAVTTPMQFYEVLKAADVKKGVKIDLINRAGKTFELLKDDGN
ncbi:MAG TPA: trypsin-like peptidase domain-containing protein [Verrucomicrobiae bacterium]|nr:trypsin-like peptidase domain-containing protein [Verrucomicrobiae bacterium]